MSPAAGKRTGCAASAASRPARQKRSSSCLAERLRLGDIASKTILSLVASGTVRFVAVANVQPSINVLT
jgi:hypothetical protein